MSVRSWKLLFTYALSWIVGVFLTKNATLQQQALALGGPITYLDAEEARLIDAREGHGLGSAWEAWKRKVVIQ